MAKILITKNFFSNDELEFEYSEQTSCPVCKAKIFPVYIAGCYSKDKKVYTFNYCPACNETFICSYSTVNSVDLIKDSNYGYSDEVIELKEDKLLSSEPDCFIKQPVDDRLHNISPRFDSIYNQALAAESNELNEIAGMGYRKALEILVKDFAIYEHPDNKEKIMKKALSRCIDEYIQNDDIAILCKGASWLGNDYAHYDNKHEDFNISDLKNLIEAACYFIKMTLIAEESKTIKNCAKDN